MRAARHGGRQMSSGVTSGPAADSNAGSAWAAGVAVNPLTTLPTDAPGAQAAQADAAAESTQHVCSVWQQPA